MVSAAAVGLPEVLEAAPDGWLANFRLNGDLTLAGRRTPQKTSAELE